MFAGRDNELDRLLTAEPPATATRPLVCLVTGRSGSGKTELAVQAAHRLGERYPGGRLFVGYRSNTGPAGHVRPEDVLAAVLVTVGAAPATTDFDLDSMTTQWRTAVGDRPFLMVAEPTPPALRAEPHRPSQRGVLRRRSRHEPLPPG
ncbi:AAA family ATPase [Streptomyces sp. SudanB52_2052]|uniref:ATP-binding protein n=1 Tax=Streptomyces sp. SudanB52_2052 TaxID=3035276 RepID=UPI003F57949B